MVILTSFSIAPPFKAELLINVQLIIEALIVLIDVSTGAVGADFAAATAFASTGFGGCAGASVLNCSYATPPPLPLIAELFVKVLFFMVRLSSLYTAPPFKAELFVNIQLVIEAIIVSVSFLAVVAVFSFFCRFCYFNKFFCFNLELQLLLILQVRKLLHHHNLLVLCFLRKYYLSNLYFLLKIAPPSPRSAVLLLKVHEFTFKFPVFENGTTKSHCTVVFKSDFIHSQSTFIIIDSPA